MVFKCLPMSNFGHWAIVFHLKQNNIIHPQTKTKKLLSKHSSFPVSLFSINKQFKQEGYGPNIQGDASWDCRSKPCSCSKHLHRELPSLHPERTQHIYISIKLRVLIALVLIVALKMFTFEGVGSSLSFPKKSADSQTGPTTSNVETSPSDTGGETSSMCCNQIWCRIAKRTNKGVQMKQVCLVGRILKCY